MQDQRDDRMNVLGHLISRGDDDWMFLNWLTTWDETWHFEYELLKHSTTAWGIIALHFLLIWKISVADFLNI